MHTWLAMLGNLLPTPFDESSSGFMGARLNPEETVKSLHSNLTRGNLE